MRGKTLHLYGSGDEAEHLAVFKALASPTRLAILELLGSGSMPIGRIATEMGLPASTAAMHVAVEKAKELKEGLIVVILPDSAERYLSTELFADKAKSTLRFYNVRTKQKEFFQPLSPEAVCMQSCGPSIHQVPHLGSYRRFIVSDMIVRYLEFKGYKVKHATNVIDLTDKTIAGAEQAGLEHGQFTKQAFGDFLRQRVIGRQRHEQEIVGSILALFF